MVTTLTDATRRARHIAEQHPHILLMLEQAAQRRGNICRRERPGCHLIQQRLEQLMIAPVDQGHIYIGVFQTGGDLQAAKPTPDNHHMLIHLIPLNE